MRGLQSGMAIALLALLGCGGVCLPVQAAVPDVELRVGERGYLRVAAIGMPPLGALVPGSRDSARQNALELAQRKLLAVLLDLPIALGKPKVRERLNARPQARERLRTLMARAQVAGQELADGSVEISLELPYAGPGGLAEFLTSLY